MRRMIAVALAVVVGTATLTACASDPVPTDVKVAWAPAGRPARVAFGEGGGVVRVWTAGPVEVV